MSVKASPGASQSAGYDTYYEEEHSSGWVTFAGVLLLMIGTVNFIEGIAAISNAHFFTANANYVIASLNTWGWVALCIGVVQWAVGLGVFVRNQFSRWVGVFILALNSVTQLLMMPAYPFWSLCLFAANIIAIYGLVAYGQHIGD